MMQLLAATGQRHAVEMQTVLPLVSLPSKPHWTSRACHAAAMPIERKLGTRGQPGKSGQDVQVVSRSHMALL